LKLLDLKENNKLETKETLNKIQELQSSDKGIKRHKIFKKRKRKISKEKERISNPILN